jgi:hypothetical protein
MPTIAEIYQTLQQHEELAKTAGAKKKAGEKTAILAPSGAGGGSPAAAIEDVIGENIAATKLRIKAKLQETAGAEQAAEGIAADADDEKPSDSQAPIVGDKMPPAGEKGVAVSPETAAAVGAGKAAEEVTPEQEKEAAEKMAGEYYAAGQIMAQGFVSELNRLQGSAE